MPESEHVRRAKERARNHTSANGRPSSRKASGSEGPGDPEPWDQPVPLCEVPEVESPPLDVLPESLVRPAQELAWAMNTPVDFAVAPILGMAGGAIGNSRRLAVTRSHSQSACLF